MAMVVADSKCVSLSYVLVCHSYGLKCVIITCGHLTNMQGCHGNCSGGLYVIAVEGTGIMQIQPKSDLLLRHFLLLTCYHGNRANWVQCCAKFDTHTHSHF